MDDLFQSVKNQILLAVIGLILLGAFVRWCRSVLRTVRRVRSRERIQRELPSKFTRGPALLMLAVAACFLAVLFSGGVERGEDTAIALILIPLCSVMGVAGLIDPRLVWSVHPDAKEKLSAKVRILGMTLAVLSFLIGLGWFLWFSFA